MAKARHGNDAKLSAIRSSNACMSTIHASRDTTRRKRLLYCSSVQIFPHTRSRSTSSNNALHSTGCCRLLNSHALPKTRVRHDALVWNCGADVCVWEASLSGRRTPTLAADSCRRAAQLHTRHTDYEHRLYEVHGTDTDTDADTEHNDTSGRAPVIFYQSGGGVVNTGVCLCMRACVSRCNFTATHVVCTHARTHIRTHIAHAVCLAAAAAVTRQSHRSRRSGARSFLFAQRWGVFKQQLTREQHSRMARIFRQYTRRAFIARQTGTPKEYLPLVSGFVTWDVVVVCV